MFHVIDHVTLRAQPNDETQTEDLVFRFGFKATDSVISISKPFLLVAGVFQIGSRRSCRVPCNIPAGCQSSKFPPFWSPFQHLCSENISLISYPRDPNHLNSTMQLIIGGEQIFHTRKIPK